MNAMPAFRSVDKLGAPAFGRVGGGVADAAKRFKRHGVVVLFAVCVAAPVTAQGSPSADRVSLDLTLGFSTVRGGGYRYVNEGGLALDALVGFRRPASNGWMGAAGLGGRADLGDDCVVDVASDPAPCLPHAATIRYVTAQSGYEVRRAGSGVRALVGPAYFSASKHGGLGVRGQLSATVALRHIGLTGGVSGNVIRPFASAPLRYIAGTFGLRIQ